MTPAPAPSETDPTAPGPTLVLGATGKTGRRVAARLEEGGHAVRRASRRSPTRFDWEDPTTWAPALDGAGAVYVIPPEHPGTDIVPFVEAIERSSVSRTVLLSARGPEQSGDGHLPGVEAAIRASATPWTILQPAWFAQNFDDGEFAADIEAGELRLPVGEGREPFIDADDIAAVAVAALTEPGHEGRTYPLSGPETLTFAEAVATVATASGRELRFVAADPDEWVADQRSHGVPEPIVQILSNLFTAIRTGVNDHVSTGMQDVLGRPPTSLATWAAHRFSPAGDAAPDPS
ncbi:NAD(P)H-binding protein [Iamia sp. SCSIO 61187]|uniref:NAD(P)H-binding protein n=1 Tax=Iamia sp. SCSIO 61187 TaxID=2722752 RepID=UPI001C62FEB9|nr:NAD(P)H-binding protein [Iamia sp. SCSIO 61187]QYG95159.1 NAD(P)H-binding protein [Iamia sp. SCSIO 61187]